MARRRYARTRTIYRKAKRAYSRRSGGLLGGAMKGVLGGAVGGAVGNFIPPNAFYGVGRGVPYLAGGFVSGSPVLKTLGWYHIGAGVVSNFMGGGGNVQSAGNGAGMFWE